MVRWVLLSIDSIGGIIIENHGRAVSGMIRHHNSLYTTEPYADLNTQWFQQLIDVTYMKIGWFLVELLMFSFCLGRCIMWAFAPITYRDANTLKRTHGAQLRVASNCRCGSQWPLLPEQ
jgi:hypothetical protein